MCVCGGRGGELAENRFLILLQIPIHVYIPYNGQDDAVEIHCYVFYDVVCSSTIDPCIFFIKLDCDDMQVKNFAVLNPLHHNKQDVTMQPHPRV